MTYLDIKVSTFFLVVSFVLLQILFFNKMSFGRSKKKQYITKFNTLNVQKNHIHKCKCLFTNFKKNFVRKISFRAEIYIFILLSTKSKIKLKYKKICDSSNPIYRCSLFVYFVNRALKHSRLGR